jgi:hypothetical protein
LSIRQGRHPGNQKELEEEEDAAVQESKRSHTSQSMTDTGEAERDKATKAQTEREAHTQPTVRRQPNRKETRHSTAEALHKSTSPWPSTQSHQLSACLFQD